MSRSPAVQQIAQMLERRGLLGAARAPKRVGTGIAPLDELLGGGWAAGRLTQLCGARSSGRTALALASAAELTRQGGVVALVDGDDALDPRRAERAGLALERTLWVRPRALGEALRAAELVLAAGG